MTRLLALLLVALGLFGCTAGGAALPGGRGAAPAPAATPPPAPVTAPAAEPAPPPAPRPYLARVDYGGVRQEETPRGPLWILPVNPRIEARVRNTPAIQWWLYPTFGDAVAPGAEPLAVLSPEPIRDELWVLDWQSPPHEPVALHLMAQVGPGHPDELDGEPVLQREGRRWVALTRTVVRALAPGESPYISEEQALAAARKIQPGAFWRARLDEGHAFEGKEGQTVRPVWMVEAVYLYGNRTRVAIDARTGRQLWVMDAEAPHFPDAPRPVSREKAVSAAQAAVGEAFGEGVAASEKGVAVSDLAVGGAEFREGYKLERPPASQVYDLWIVEFINQGDGQAAGRALIHGYTGEVLALEGFATTD